MSSTRDSSISSDEEPNDTLSKTEDPKYGKITKPIIVGIQYEINLSITVAAALMEADIPAAE
jgi:hypothetical protein